MNPIVVNEVITLVVQYDTKLIFDHLVELISVLAAVCLYFVGNYELKNQFFEQILKILEITRKEFTSKPTDSLVAKEQICQIVNLKIFEAFLGEFENLNSHHMEEAL